MDASSLLGLLKERADKLRAIAGLIVLTGSAERGSSDGSGR